MSASGLKQISLEYSYSYIGKKRVNPRVENEHTTPVPVKPVSLTGTTCTGAGFNHRYGKKPVVWKTCDKPSTPHNIFEVYNHGV